MQNTFMPLNFVYSKINYYCIIIAECKLAKIIRICEFTRARIQIHRHIRAYTDTYISVCFSYICKIMIM